MIGLKREVGGRNITNSLLEVGEGKRRNIYRERLVQVFGWFGE
jgi:hypothetical protein